MWTPLSSYSQLSCTMTILRVAQQHCKSVTLSINFHFSSHNPNLHHQFSLLTFFLSLFPCIQCLPISELCLNKSWDGVRLAFSYLWQQKRDALEQEFWFFFCGKNLLPSGIPLKECVWCTCLIIDGQFCNLGLLRELL